jgi:hypothetical protein
MMRLTQLLLPFVSKTGKLLGVPPHGFVGIVQFNQRRRKGNIEVLLSHETHEEEGDFVGDVLERDIPEAVHHLKHQATETPYVDGHFGGGALITVFRTWPTAWCW